MDQTIALVEMYRNLKSDKIFIRSIFVFSLLSILLHVTIVLISNKIDFNSPEYLPLILVEFTKLSAIPFVFSLFSIVTTLFYERKFRIHLKDCEYNNKNLGRVYGIILKEKNKGYSLKEYDEQRLKFLNTVLETRKSITGKNSKEETEHSILTHKIIIDQLKYIELDHIVSERYGYYGKSGKFFFYSNYYKILHKNYFPKSGDYSLIRVKTISTKKNSSVIQFNTESTS